MTWMRRQLSSRFPPIAWRDAELANRRDEISELTRQVAQLVRDQQALRSDLADREQALQEAREGAVSPSYRRDLLNLRRHTKDLAVLDPDRWHPLRRLPFKLRNYRLAASHGFATPSVLAIWEGIDEMELDMLPEQFVVKSDGGAGSQGVLPLCRVGPDRYQRIGAQGVLTGAGVREHFGQRSAVKKARPPFFAEAFIPSATVGNLPDDIKVFACHGNVERILLRRVAEHGKPASVRQKYVDAEGTDLGEVIVGRPLDPSIPVPESLAEIVSMASHLSRAVGVPMVRVDLYATPTGLLLGELTRGPGGTNVVDPVQDARLGRAWEQARFRIELDIIAGRPPGIIHGPHPMPELYPAGHISRSADPGPWAPTVVECERWCLGAPRE